MNQEKLNKMQAQVRIGGKGTARRKKKVVHRTNTTDDKKLQSSLKKLAVSNIPGIEEVNMIKDDGSVIHFNNPKVQASLAANTFAVSGHGENKQITEMLPGILNQLGPEGLNHLKRLANVATTASTTAAVADDDDDVPQLVADFDEPSKGESVIKTDESKSSEEKGDAKPAEEKKDEAKPAEEKKDEAKPAEDKKVEAKPEVTPAAETKAPEAKPEDTKLESPKKEEPSKVASPTKPASPKKDEPASPQKTVVTEPVVAKNEE